MSKDAATRAQEALDVAERRVKKLEAKRDALRAEANVIQEQFEEAVKRRDYLAQNPDLPEQPKPLTDPEF